MVTMHGIEPFVALCNGNRIPAQLDGTHFGSEPEQTRDTVLFLYSVSILLLYGIIFIKSLASQGHVDLWKRTYPKLLFNLVPPFQSLLCASYAKPVDALLVRRINFSFFLLLGTQAQALQV